MPGNASGWPGVAPACLLIPMHLTLGGRIMSLNLNVLHASRKDTLRIGMDIEEPDAFKRVLDHEFSPAYREGKVSIKTSRLYLKSSNSLPASTLP